MKFLDLVRSVPVAVRRIQVFAKRNWFISALLGLTTIVASTIIPIVEFLRSPDKEIQTASSSPQIDRRDNCEKLIARGLKCDASGFLEALKNDDRTSMDLFLSLGFGPSSIYRSDSGETEVWSIAFHGKYPGLSYALDQRPREKISSKGGCNRFYSYTCNPAIEVWNRRWQNGDPPTKEMRCRIIRQAGGRSLIEQMRSEKSKIFEEKSTEYIAEWHDRVERRCGGHLLIEGYADVDAYCHNYNPVENLPYQACYQQVCDKSKAFFLQEYPTGEKFAAAQMEEGGDNIDEVIAEVEQCS